MKIINITQAREQLPQLMDEVFLNSKTYLITRRGIPMVKIIKADKSQEKKQISKKVIRKSIRLAGNIKGIWNESEWENKSSLEIVDILRQRSQRTYVR